MSLPDVSHDPAAAPVLLALDTATDRIHAALSAKGDVRVVNLPGGAQASATLLPALAQLLAQAGLSWQQIDAIAFGRGPGAFTGLRTACAVTQGLALGLNRPVLPMDTLMAVAEDARLNDPAAWVPGDVLWVLQDARMDELYVAAYQWQGPHEGAEQGTRWQQVHEPQVWPLNEPARRWSAALAGGDPVSTSAPAQPRIRLAGNAMRAYPACFVDAIAQGAQCVSGSGGEDDADGAKGPDRSFAMPTGRALASLAQQAWAAGQTVDAALALPLYVRDKVAQTTAERQAARSL